MPRPPHACLGCGRDTTYGPRCKPCRDDQKRKYMKEWRARSKAARTASPRCEHCGTTDDLTTDHVVPGSLAHGVQVLCRSCNSKKRNG